MDDSYPMITFFTHTRPFEGEFDELQRTAMKSWETAVPGCEVFSVTGNVTTNNHGTALVSSIFETGERQAANELLCEISSDIILGGNIAAALEVIKNIPRPFVIGQRWDIDRGAKPETAKLHPDCAVDYFIYRRGTIGDIPPFAVGRTCYDNWLVWAAIHKWDCTVIDATHDITAVHVNHGYPEYGNKQKMLQSEEVKENRRLMNESGARLYGVKHAPYVLVNGEVTKR
jgi:hypothetical protein